MDCMLYQILFRGSVTNLLRLVLLREYNLCEADIRSVPAKKKKERKCRVRKVREYEKGKSKRTEEGI